MKCPRCGNQLDVQATEEYEISEDLIMKRYIKAHCSTTYKCGNCNEELFPYEISEILKQVDEL